LTFYYILCTYGLLGGHDAIKIKATQICSQIPVLKRSGIITWYSFVLELEILTGTVAIVVLRASVTDTVGDGFSHTKPLVLLLETLDRWFLDISSSVSISALKKRQNYT
jgi:hypothetical protein